MCPSPCRLPSLVLLIVLAFVAMRVIPHGGDRKQYCPSNVLLSAIPFILIFVGILLPYITLIVHRGHRDQRRRVAASSTPGVMRIIIAGILHRRAGHVPAWAMAFYTQGFNCCFIATLSYILWSHVRPVRRRRSPVAGKLAA